MAGSCLHPLQPALCALSGQKEQQEGPREKREMEIIRINREKNNTTKKKKAITPGTAAGVQRTCTCCLQTRAGLPAVNIEILPERAAERPGGQPAAPAEPRGRRAALGAPAAHPQLRHQPSERGERAANTAGLGGKGGKEKKG